MDAAYIVRANSAELNTFPDFPDSKWAVTVPPESNKTKKNYQWGMPNHMNKYVEMMQELHKING